MLGPFSIDTPFPAFRAMAEDFDVGIGVDTNRYSLFLKNM
jgi:hypothetical protein